MERHEHARLVATVTKDYVIGLLHDAGYVLKCHPDNTLDIITANTTIRVEIKGALWTKARRAKGRYQFNTTHNADIYILACMQHAPRCFVIPGNVIGARAHVAIWSEYPCKYIGKWAEYCDAWNLIDKALGR